MRRLQDFLNERSSEILNLKRNKWQKIDVKKIDFTDKEKLSSEFFDLINTAYSAIGGHANFKSSSDIFSDKDLDFWQGIDLHQTPELDLIIFGKETKYGIKLTGVGHDGSKISKTEYLEDKAKKLTSKGYYNEVSGKLSEILLNKYKIPSVDNQEDVEKVLGKKVKWYGVHPTEDLPGKGWYSREIGGHEHIKILLGKPKGI